MTDAVALTGMTIQLRLQTPYDLVLAASVGQDFTQADVIKAMDMLTSIAEREQLKGELMSLKATLRRNKERLMKGDFDRDIDKLRSDRAEFDKQASAAFVARGRRGNVTLNGQQKTKLSEFDKQIEMTLKAKADVVNGIPLIEWQIDCLYARINGEKEPPMPDKVLAVLSQIEFPEDVGFASSLAA